MDRHASVSSVYPGTFDPPTEGHRNIIERGLKLFDRLIVAVAIHPLKKTTLAPSERVTLLHEMLGARPNLEIDSFEGQLLVNYVRSKKATVILRGLRTFQDYEYELQMALANRRLAPEIETVFMMAESEYAHLSSTLIKEIIALGGSGKGMVPLHVEEALRRKRIK